MKAGRELDTLIAEKVMEWTEIQPDIDGKLWGRTSYGEFRLVPDYSVNISAAWEIVTLWEHKSWSNGEPEYFRILSPLNKEEGYVVEIVWAHHDGDIVIARANAPEAPHAICLAALKASPDK